MSSHDRATPPPLFQRPVVFWLILLPMLLLVVALVTAAVMRERSGRAVLAEEALRYEVQAAAIDQAEARRVAQENARRSASMQ